MKIYPKEMKSKQFFGTLREKERKRNDRQILGSCQRTVNVVEYGGDGGTSCSWCTWNGS